MKSVERIQLIKERLAAALQPTFLDVQDDSEKHIGHAGAKDGAGHYTVFIGSEQFQNQARIDIHRQIYSLLDDLIPKEIHALRIVIENHKLNL